MAKEAITDEHHLIHKAAGWMLREVGKRDKDLLTDFLVKYKSQMPRTMLRYAIEKYSENQRKAFLAKD
jgi:3-methyladenine DNA glycosylase AlkD